LTINTIAAPRGRTFISPGALSFSVRDWWKRRDFRFFAPKRQTDLTGARIDFVSHRRDRMADEGEIGYGDVATEVRLGDRESVTGTFDPKQRLGVGTGQQGGTVFTFHLTIGGKDATLKGGKRLLSAFQSVVKPTDKPTLVRITAKGEARTLERDYKVERVKA